MANSKVTEQFELEENRQTGGWEWFFSAELEGVTAKKQNKISEYGFFFVNFLMTNT